MERYKKQISAVLSIFISLTLIVSVVYASNITTINGTDTISSSRTVINTNFSNLNSGKPDSSIPFVTIGNTSSIAFERALTGTANQITITDNGANSSVVLSIPNPFIVAMASISTSFEVLGTASVSGKFTGISATASNSFGGGLTVSRHLYASGGLILQTITSTTTTLTTTGELALNTSSNSLDYYNGSAQIVQSAIRCFTIPVDSPTASNPKYAGNIVMDDPFTITTVYGYASGTNAAGWNLTYGPQGSIVTDVFSTNRSASTSLKPVYTTFANASIPENNVLTVHITSSSAKLQNLSPKVCGRKTK